MIFFDRSNRKLSIQSICKITPGARIRTISVASTRVPTIFRRIRVFFSMICGGKDNGEVSETELVLPGRLKRMMEDSSLGRSASLGG